ncbi:hypothetical protein Vretifemale_6045 [Volvox reticuliferus]|uniref:Uncharacterized protein n=1 Tax=Volvox reticuliferus TaxID=1737510 RepID=A0A8J4C6G9_9CHLO|nr:hypothetical protein Vretifemale_6045 [Volvox reticuliferus]
MPAHETLHEGPHIEVHYGFDDGYDPPCYFFYVQDDRLGFKEGAAEAVDRVCSNFCEEGDGYYFDLHVGHTGFGQKVSREVMAEFWKRFGVPEPHVDAVKQGRTW